MITFVSWHVAHTAGIFTMKFASDSNAGATQPSILIFHHRSHRHTEQLELIPSTDMSQETSIDICSIVPHTRTSIEVGHKKQNLNCTRNVHSKLS
jgi:hypothetical protein